MRRPDKLFGHRLWMTPVASYLGLAAMVYGVFVGTPLLWALAAFGSFMMLMGVTVGMHRLFCHRAFRTGRFWHYVLGVLGTCAFYGSTVQWPAMHASHHQFADTPQDPHYTGWRYLFWKKNNPTIFNKRVLRRLYQDPLHRVLHQYYVLIPLALSVLLYLIDPLVLVFGYLIPLGWLHLVGALHQVYAHGPDGARDLGFLELVLPTGGEWHHAEHHRKPKQLKFGTFDLGAHFISAIKNTGIR